MNYDAQEVALGLLSLCPNNLSPLVTSPTILAKKKQGPNSTIIASYVYQTNFIPNQCPSKTFCAPDLWIQCWTHVTRVTLFAMAVGRMLRPVLCVQPHESETLTFGVLSLRDLKAKEEVMQLSPSRQLPSSSIDIS